MLNDFLQLDAQSDMASLAQVAPNEEQDTREPQFASITEHDEGDEDKRLIVFTLWRDEKAIAVFATRQGAIQAAENAGWIVV